MPHNEREQEEKDHFYVDLTQTIDGCNKNNILVVMGDLGGDNKGYESCMGRHGMGAKNRQSREALRFFCAKWPGHYRKVVSAQRYLQGNMGISKRESEESDRPSADQRAVEICSPRRKSAQGGRYQQRTLSRQDQHPAETYVNMKKFKPRFNTDRETTRMYCEAVKSRLEENRA